MRIRGTSYFTQAATDHFERLQCEGTLSKQRVLDCFWNFVEREEAIMRKSMFDRETKAMIHWKKDDRAISVYILAAVLIDEAIGIWVSVYTPAVDHTLAYMT
jgi:hypothetical protein